MLQFWDISVCNERYFSDQYLTNFILFFVLKKPTSMQTESPSSMMLFMKGDFNNSSHTFFESCIT